MEGSESGSIHEEEYTTALPAFSSKEVKDKDKRDRGFRGVLPFQRKRKDKEKDKDKGKDRDRSADRDGRGGSALGAYGDMGSLRGKGSSRGERERDERGGRDEKRDEEF